MIDFFNDFDKVNEKEDPKPETVEKQAEKTEPETEKTEEKEDTNDFSKTLESLRNEITALKELLKNSSQGSNAGDAENENKTESEEDKE